MSYVAARPQIPTLDGHADTCTFIHVQRVRECAAVPVIATFHGISIRMYFFDDRRHSTPHIHAEYAEFRAVFGILSGELLAGELPPRQARLVQQWIHLRAPELQADWKLAIAGLPLQSIEPLAP